jgi:hypothetical protein
MFCQHCGFESPDGSKYCNDCGKQMGVMTHDETASYVSPIPNQKNKNRSTKRKFIYGSISSFCLIIIVVIMVTSLGGGNSYYAERNAVMQSQTDDNRYWPADMQAGELEGGVAVKCFSAAYWVNDGVVYAVNGRAKDWSPGIEWAPGSTRTNPSNPTITVTAVEEAVE